MTMKLLNLLEAAKVAPILYFDFTSLFSAVVYLSYTRYILATKKKEIQSIVQQALWILQLMPKKETKNCFWIPIRIKYQAILLHCVLLLKILITVVVDLEKNGWNFNSWWGTQEQRFRETFRVTSSYHPIFTWWYGITHIYNSFNFGVADFFLLTASLIYFELVSCFRDSLNEKNSDFQQVMDNYKIIRKVAADISDISGLYIFGYTVSVVAFYVTHLLDIVRPMPFPIRLLYCLQTIYFVAIFYYIAAGNSMMTSFQRWICKQENYRNEKLSVKDLHVTLYELVNYPVAICSPGIFTVTFNLLGKLAGIVLTYTIVAMQFRNIS